MRRSGTKTIVTFVGSQSDYNFFHRLAIAIEPLEYSFVFLTPKLSLFIAAKRNGVDCRLIRYSKNTTHDANVMQTSEVAGKSVNVSSASSFYHAVQELAVTVHADTTIDVVAVWNGSTIPTKALAQFALNNDIKTVFFELSNIPGKIFVDPIGVNTRSLLFSSPHILERFRDDDQQSYKIWKDNYLHQKRIEQTTDTARYQSKVNNYLFLLDAFGSAFMNLPTIGNMDVFTKAKEKIFKTRYAAKSDRYDLQNGKYIFFPMQVSNDSQLLFNSSFNNVDGIKICMQKSVENNYDVIVKPHPTECNEIIFQQLRLLQRTNPFLIVTEPTMKIIEHAAEVVTLNSTVGLEAMIAGKKVTFLGNTFYSAFNDESLRHYIMGYLIEVDYFSRKEIPLNIARQIVERIDLR